MRDFSVQPEQISGAAPKFVGVAHEVETALERLQSRLAGLGAFWGDDEQGDTFAAQYVPNASTVQRASANIVEGLASIAVALEVHADNHTKTDEALSRVFDPGPRR